MVKFGCGIVVFLMGLGLLGWLVFNVFIERQAEFNTSVMGFLFLAGLLFVGFKWLSEGWPEVQSQFRPKKRKKKNRRSIDEDYE